jgi:flavin-dependent dehydrogenase
VGIGCSAIKTTKALRFFDDLLNKIVRLKNLSKDEKKIKGSYLPAGGVNTLFASNGVILIGDAGGFVDPFSGEGIFGAVESGKLAARCIDNFYQGKAELPEKSFTRAACNLFITEFRYSLVLACILGGKGFWFNLIKKNRQLGKFFRM